MRGGLEGGATGARWYVVRTLRAREVLAESHLRNQGFQNFLPLQRITVRRARKFHSKEAPVFPGYLFVSLDLGWDRWRAVNATVGVAYLISVRDRPVPVPRGLVEKLQLVYPSPDQQDLAPDLAPGDRVRVVSGPLAELFGQLQEIDGAGRVKILLDVMGREALVWTKAGSLLPVA